MRPVVGPVVDWDRAPAEAWLVHRPVSAKEMMQPCLGISLVLSCLARASPDQRDDMQVDKTGWIVSLVAAVRTRLETAQRHKTAKRRPYDSQSKGSQTPAKSQSNTRADRTAPHHTCSGKASGKASQKPAPHHTVPGSRMAPSGLFGAVRNSITGLRPVGASTHLIDHKTPRGLGQSCWVLVHSGGVDHGGLSTRLINHNPRLFEPSCWMLSPCQRYGP